MLIVLTVMVWPCRADAEDETSPTRFDLTERAGRQLVQLDVALEGAPDRIVGLTPEDFKVWVGGKPVADIAIDSLCGSWPTENPEGAVASSTKATATPAPTSFLFYFDQRNLTVAGRENSLELAQTMISRLIRGGNRGTIVSHGKRLVTFASSTDRTEPLVAALERLRRDPLQWDDYPALEEHRQQDVLRAGHTSRDAACQQARIYQREELARTESALDLFSTVLGRFAELDPPKIAVYFADTLRDDPGRHYFARLPRCQPGSFDAKFAFRRVHENAAALGVKIYAVQAEGLVAPDVMFDREARDAAVRDAQSGLKVLALETGGDAFINGVTAERMVGRIEADAACVYLLSFDPAPFPQDRALAVQVQIERRGVRARTRSHIVIQSEPVRRMARLLAAFAAPENLRDAMIMQGGVVPLGVEEGRLRTLVQASLPGTRQGGAEEWDLGMSLVSGSGVRDQASGRIAINRPGGPIVLEAEMALRPGSFDLALVAIENVTGTVATGRIVGAWSEKDGTPRIAPIAVLQPAQGAFLRDGEVRSEGSLVVGDNQRVRADLPTALVTLVCRGGKERVALRVDRTLTGETSTTLPPIELLVQEAPCAQVRDLIPGHTLSTGRFTYSVSVDGTDVVESRVLDVN